MFATRHAGMGMGSKAFRDRFIPLLALLALSTRCCRDANADGEHAPKEQGQVYWHCQNDADVGPTEHGNNGYTNLPFVQFEPVVRGGKVFWAVPGRPAAAPGKGGELRRILTVCAADIRSGKALWQAKIEMGHDMFQGLAPVDKVLWVLLEHKATRLDMNSGNIGKQLSLLVQSMPVMDGRQGFFASSCGMVAFNFDREVAAWKSEATPFGACGYPPPTLDKERAYYVHPARSEVVALDRRTGAEEWSTGLRWCQSGVTVDQSYVFATSHIDPANTAQKCSLHKLNKVDGKELGKVALPAKRPARNASFQPYIDDSYVYVVQPASFTVFRKSDLQVVFGHDHDSAGQTGEVGCSYVARPIPLGRDILLTVRRCTLSMHSGTGIHRGDSTIYYVFSPMEKRFSARSAMLRGAPLSAPSIHEERIYQTTEEGGLLCYDFRNPSK